MKQILTILALFVGFSLNAQFNCPDTVCAGDSINYWVQSTPGSTYSWTLTGGGTLINSPTSQVAVNWGQVNGTYTLTVTETNPQGCVGNPVVCQIDIMQPVVQVLPITNVCQDSPSFNLQAFPTGGTWIVNGNSSSGLFNPLSPGIYNVLYTYTNIAGCTTSAGTSFTVYPLPNTSPVIHD